MQRDNFILPPKQIYMCGHSLGPMPKSVKSELDEAMNRWGSEAVKAWNTDAWIDLPYQVAKKIAPLIGAHAENVVMGDSTSVNLFKVLLAALKLNAKRKVILTTCDNFPADIYIADGIKALREDIILKVVPRESLTEYLDESVAVLMLTHVNYRDASAYDMSYLTKLAHQQGILTVWDLSHSVGAVPTALQTANADFAVGCTYKYLSGGPGAPAFIYVHEKYHAPLTCPIYGWMGHENPFAFERSFKAAGIKQFVSGTPYVLGLKTLNAALKYFEAIDMSILHEATLKHSRILAHALQDMQLEVITPMHNMRGGHVAFIHDEAYALSQALIEYGVITDYREPHLIRLCVNPLYLSLFEIHACIEKIAHILNQGIFRASKYKKIQKVT